MLPLLRRSAAARLLLAGSSLCAALLLLPFSASASAIQVSYTVVSGSFSTNGVITENIQTGALTYVVPVLGSNTTAFTATATPILQALVLIGTGGSTLALPPQLISGGFTQHNSTLALITGFLSTPSGFLFHQYPALVTPFGFGNLSFTTSGGDLKRHAFVTSNEVRSVIPEPGTGLLMGLGLAGLGVAGRLGGARARALRARGA